MTLLSIKKNLSKSLRVSGAFKHPKYAGLVNDIALLNDDSFRKTKLLKFFFSKKSKKSPSDSPTSHPLKRTLPADVIHVFSNAPSSGHEQNMQSFLKSKSPRVVLGISMTSLNEKA
ncbi:hypothetical protein QVD17_02693 [Tagetes erecta]|uniref:Uncharacterized protein n=1 Tax=Tagetes erecta TaxID=13708 RepID=A0AAD8P929_TARER|nr:hypothetical protein QVD17_02693 [Tagetes erecta]